MRHTIDTTTNQIITFILHCQIVWRCRRGKERERESESGLSSPVESARASCAKRAVCVHALRPEKERERIRMRYCSRDPLDMRWTVFFLLLNGFVGHVPLANGMGTSSKFFSFYIRPITTSRKCPFDSSTFKCICKVFGRAVDRHWATQENSYILHMISEWRRKWNQAQIILFAFTRRLQWMWLFHRLALRTDWRLQINANTTASLFRGRSG